MAERPDLIERLSSIAKDYEGVARADEDAEEDLAVAATIREAIAELLRLREKDRQSTPTPGGVLPLEKIDKIYRFVA
ncbi:hypothetical protein ACIKTA_08865 [Hansschlegelia beijingensis]